MKEEKPVIDAAAAAAALNALDCDATDAEVFLTKWVASIRPPGSSAGYQHANEAATSSEWSSSSSPSVDSPESGLDIIEHDEGFQWGAESELSSCAPGPDPATAALRWHLRWSEEDAPADDGLSCGAALSQFLEQQQTISVRGAETGYYANSGPWASSTGRGGDYGFY